LKKACLLAELLRKKSVNMEDAFEADREVEERRRGRRGRGRGRG
jgi:hypothetical protein